MVSLQTGVAPVHPGRRQFRVNLDRAFQVTEGQVKVALVLPLQVNRRPVHVHAGSSHAGVDSPLQVIQGPVQVARPIPRDVGRGPVEVRGRQVGNQFRRPGQVGDGQVLVARPASFQVGQTANAVGVGGPWLYRQDFSEPPDGLVQVGVLAAQVGLAQPVAQIGQGSGIRRRTLQSLVQHGLGRFILAALQVYLAERQ